MYFNLYILICCIFRFDNVPRNENVHLNLYSASKFVFIQHSMTSTTNDNTFWTRNQLFFVGASSLHAATEGFLELKDKVFSVPGLKIKKDPWAQSAQAALDGKHKDKQNLVLWHDLINNSVSIHPRRHTPHTG